MAQYPYLLYTIVDKHTKFGAFIQLFLFFCHARITTYMGSFSVMDTACCLSDCYLIENFSVWIYDTMIPSL